MTRKNQKKEDATAFKQSKEPIFGLVKTDGKVQIVLGSYLASPLKFDNFDAAEEYIASKPYELIINVACIYMDFNTRKNETKKNTKENA